MRRQKIWTTRRRQTLETSARHRENNATITVRAKSQPYFVGAGGRPLRSLHAADHTAPALRQPASARPTLPTRTRVDTWGLGRS